MKFYIHLSFSPFQLSSQLVCEREAGEGAPAPCPAGAAAAASHPKQSPQPSTLLSAKYSSSSIGKMVFPDCKGTIQPKKSRNSYLIQLGGASNAVITTPTPAVAATVTNLSR